MVSVKERPVEVEPDYSKTGLDGFLVPLEEEKYGSWDIDTEPGYPVSRRNRGSGDWRGGFLKATVKGLVWFMDYMCLGLCPWVKKS